MSEHSDLEPYLERFARQLLGPRRYRHEMVAEVRAHLLDLAGAEAGSSSSADMFRRFGDLDQLAGELNQVRRARRRRHIRKAAVAFVGVAVVAPVSLTGFVPRNVATHTEAAAGSHRRVPMAVTLDPRTGFVLLRTRLFTPHAR
jgi:hypothetical protein